MKTLRTAVLALVAVAAGVAAKAQQPITAVAYVAKVTGAPAARLGDKDRKLDRFSPLYQGDLILLSRGGSVVARFLQSGQMITIDEKTPPAQRRIVTPKETAPTDKGKVIGAIFEGQGKQLALASRNARTASRPGPTKVPAVETLLPRGLTITSGLNFRWTLLKPSTVTIELIDSDGTSLWKKDEIMTSSVVYPSDAPPLKPGKYRWVVSLGDGSKDGTEFEIASEDKTTELMAQLESLSTVKFVDEEEKLLTTATLYQRFGFFGASIEILQKIADKKPSAMVQVTLFQAWAKLNHSRMKNDRRATLGNIDQLNAVNQWDRP